MKFRADLVDFEDTDFARKQCIGSAQDGSCIHRANRLDVRDLAVRVNARVRAPRTRHGNLVIEKLPKSLLQLPLNRVQLRLNLPTMEVCPVIGKSQLEVAHSIGYSMGLGFGAMPAISATIITFNEADRIIETIGSLSSCDEVLVVDSGSTDKTREFAQA